MSAPDMDLGDSYLGFGRPMPLGIEDADFRQRERRVDLLRAFGRSFRYRKDKEGVLPPWHKEVDGEELTEGRAALRYIAAGFAVFADDAEPDDPSGFRNEDWALFSGSNPEKDKSEHQDAFVEQVRKYINGIWVYEQIGTSGLPDKDGGDYEFVLRDVIALIYTFRDHPQLLTNCMVRKLIGQDQVTFSSPDAGCGGTTGTAQGIAPFAGQNLDQWLAEGPNGRHFFEYTYFVPYPFTFPPVPGEQNLKFSTPETENHLLGIYAWRYLLNEYLEYVSLLPQGHARRDPCLVALFESDLGRYRNGPDIRDFVLQLLGRIPHAGCFEANAKPYHSITVQAVMTFLAAASLFPGDGEREKVTTAARNALDYFAAEFAFQSLEGKRIAPSRRQYKKRAHLGLYDSDYLANIFGVLTGAYVYSDEIGEPSEPGGSNEPAWALRYHWNNIGENAGYALWSLLSGYRVPRPVHGFLLNKHAGYLARLQNRATSETYPLHVRWHFGLLGLTEADDPPIARPRYFADVKNGTAAPSCRCRSSTSRHPDTSTRRVVTPRRTTPTRRTSRAGPRTSSPTTSSTATTSSAGRPSCSRGATCS